MLTMPKPIRIIIPLFKRHDLFEKQVIALSELSSELISENAIVTFINDSPDDRLLKSSIDEFKGSSRSFPLDFIENSSNLGFIKSTNIGLRMCLAEKVDALLLNSDARLTSGALSEIRYVSETDNFIGFVSPRSNNATICTLPTSQYNNRPESASDIDISFMKSLPRVSYSPTAVGFCLLIKYSILQDFGLLDEVYGMGYNEENDLIMRANRLGYRAVLANWAYVFHMGSASFGTVDVSHNAHDVNNRKLLDSRYPEYSASISSYFRSAQFRTELLYSNSFIGPANRPRVVFDLSNVGTYHNGTSELAVTVVKEFCHKCSSFFDIYIDINPNSLHFHELDRFPDIKIAQENDTFLFSMRFGNYFDYESIYNQSLSAAIVGVMLLDTISLDCQYLESQTLLPIWTIGIKCADFLLFNSEFTQNQFRLRLNCLEDKRQNSVLHSFESNIRKNSNFTNSKRIDLLKSKHILIIGNNFSHKNVRPIVNALISRGYSGAVVVLSSGEPFNSDNVKSLKSGNLSSSEINELYFGASLIVFPTHYEGFGFPIIHALALKKPIIVRDIPCFREIALRHPFRENIHFAQSDSELISFVFNPSLKWIDCASDIKLWPWSETVNMIEKMFMESWAEINYSTLLEKQYLLDSLRDSTLFRHKKDAIKVPKKLKRSAFQRFQRSIKKRLKLFRSR
jgi:GT2 family glycosyltransferase